MGGQSDSREPMTSRLGTVGIILWSLLIAVLITGATWLIVDLVFPFVTW